MEQIYIHFEGMRKCFSTSVMRFEAESQQTELSLNNWKALQARNPARWRSLVGQIAQLSPGLKWLMAE